MGTKNILNFHNFNFKKYNRMISKQIIQRKNDVINVITDDLSDKNTQRNTDVINIITDDLSDKNTQRNTDVINIITDDLSDKNTQRNTDIITDDLSDKNTQRNTDIITDDLSDKNTQRNTDVINIITDDLSDKNTQRNTHNPNIEKDLSINMVNDIYTLNIESENSIIMVNDMNTLVKNNNSNTDKDVSINMVNDKLILTQYHIESNQEISRNKYTKLLSAKKPDNHLDLLNSLILSNLRKGGLAPVSKIFIDFINICTSTNCDPNIAMSSENCIIFLKHSIKNIDIEIVNIFNHKSKHSSLNFSLSTENLNHLHFNLPMIVKPRNWEANPNFSNAYYGGYLHNKNNLVPLITPSHKLNTSKTIISDRLIFLINKLQEKPFDIEAIEKTYISHKREYERNLNKLNSMNQTTKFQKLLYYKFKDEFITNNTYLLKSYEDFLKIISDHEIKEFFLLFSLCFRGRIYASGLISPTADKNLRQFISPLKYNGQVIEIDASASILQILGTISCSIKLGNITNIFSDKNDTWSYLLDLILNVTEIEADSILDNYFSKSIGKKFKAKDILESIKGTPDKPGLIDRNIIKYTVMRILYSSNPFQISKDFKQEYSSKNLSYKHILFIYATFAYYFENEINVLKIIKLLNKYMIKDNSKGLMVSNSFISYENTYFKTIKKELRFRDKDNKIREVQIELKTDELDLIKSNNASCPNFFHNIDSEICLSVIEEFNNRNKFIFTIHDAFIIALEDQELLIKTYNSVLFRQHHRFIDLIELHKPLIKTSKKDGEIINHFLTSLKERKEEYVKKFNSSKPSMNTLKVQTRNFSTQSNKKTVKMLKYEIDLKIHMSEAETLLHIYADKLLLNYPNRFLEGYVQIYSHQLTYVGGPRLKVSTQLFPLDRIRDCLAEFSGKMEHYGTSSTNYIPILQNLKFSGLNHESLNIISEIDNEIKTEYSSKPDFISLDLWTDLESIITKIKLDEVSTNYGINNESMQKIKDKVKEKIDSGKDSTKTVVNKYQEKYDQILSDIKLEKNKAKDLQNKDFLNKKTTLANYYVKKYNVTKRHFSTRAFNSQEMQDLLTNLSNQRNNKEFEDNIIKHGEQKALKYRERKFINPLDNGVTLSNSFFILAADFETVVHNNKHYVFCASIYYHPNKNIVEEDEYKIKYIDIIELKSDFSNLEILSNSVLLNFWDDLNFIMETKFKKKDIPLIYFHNFNKFDGVFIFKLVSLLLDRNDLLANEIEIIQRNNTFYQLKLKNITLRDSIHLIPGSLNDLAKTFLDQSKKEIDIHFTYNTIVGKRNEIIDYCKHDTFLLFGVIKEFKLRMEKIFNINPLSVLTISSLAFKILRGNFIEGNQIENSSSSENKHQFIAASYRGGFSGVFKPIEEDFILSHIDVNSSYPFSMTKEIPHGVGIWVEKSHLESLNKNINEINREGLRLFGYFDISIHVEKIRNISPLIIKYQTKLTDVLGTIRVTLFSEEINFIMRNGGTIIEFYAGIVYEKKAILAEFANGLYNKRISTHDKTEKLIYKLILNSAYGRFALRENVEVTKVSTNRDFNLVSQYRSTSNEINIGEGHTIFSIHRTENDQKHDLPEETDELNKLVNTKIHSKALRAIQIASAISSYSRITLLEQAFKIIDLGGTVYYMDTDSIFSDFSEEQLISLNNISNKLGDWKIEHLNLKGIFIQSKFYLTMGKEKDSEKVKLKSVPRAGISDLENDPSVWEIFRKRLSGIPISLQVDKHFSRNLKDLSIDVKLGMNFHLSEKGNKKREEIIKDGKWVSTESFSIVYDSNTPVKNKHLILKTGESNLKMLNIAVNMENLLIKIKGSVSERLKFYKIKLPNSIDLKFSSYNLARYEIKLLLSKNSDHQVRLLFVFDGKKTSSSFLSLDDALDFISKIEELYEWDALLSINIRNKVCCTEDFTNIIITSLESSLSRIDRSQITNEDLTALFALFIKYIKNENIVEGVELFYNEFHQVVESVVNRILRLLEIETTDGKKLNMLKLFIIDEVIKGYPIW